MGRRAVSQPFDANSLESQYAFVDALPESLLAEVITFPSGTLAERVDGVLRWRTALLEGRLPAPGPWPPAHIEAAARLSVEQLGIARFCRGEPELVDELLRDLLLSFASRARTFAEEVLERLRELERLERKRLQSEEADLARRKKRNARRIELDESARRRLAERAERELAQRVSAPDEGVLNAWGERVRAWSAIHDVFGDLGELLGRGWDLSLGVLRHVGWSEVLRLQELVKRLPELREVVRTLGRLHASEKEASVAEQVMAPVRRLEEERRLVRAPHVPAETRGIERSAELARMLPSEALMLGHPKLRLLWHARRAERALLTYRVEGLVTERTLVERERLESTERKRPRQERGPVVAVVDTSGSMHGTPEHVAKALVLEALRTAHAERRRAFVYAYSGPGQILEHELSLTPEGLANLLSFLGFTFGGGSDEASVVARVLERLRSEEWKQADVLYISDGEWPVAPEVESAVKAARKHGNRFHGVQVGNLGTTGLHRLCDPVHVFANWAALGDWR